LSVPLTTLTFFRPSRFCPVCRVRWPITEVKSPRAPCEVHALQRFPLASSPSPPGPRAALPFRRTSRLCSADQSLVRWQLTRHRPVSSPGLRASQPSRGTVSLRLPESSLPTVALFSRVLHLRYLPTVLPPDIPFGASASLEGVP